MAVVVKRFDVYLVSLDPTVGAEIQKTRPCLIISPDEMNAYIQTAIIAPMRAMSVPMSDPNGDKPWRQPCCYCPFAGWFVHDVP